ncbi:uncharacterized protein EI90DRAFT_3069359 [Cantharellus anzutake]|uniref:uncharacterized protein n=1 Tax=Cantharellus anzutake TaxID=1750568 RepID=UPI0019064DD3|nr:uncharacterized protein EI90DRAFT_3069359 [Cantharellus anzutake]KAF8326868.1 hypothetical protein EI90DRAFT_3069359 [Cantharellus anzutake]
MKIDRAAEYAGFLLMCWGGTLGVHSLLSLPPPQILSLHPYINYLTPHVFLSTLFSQAFPSPSLLKFIDTVLPMVDAILRTGGITSSIHLALTHPTHPQLRSSLFLQLLLGAVASAGGGVLAGTLNVFSAHWSFTTPPFLRSNTPSGSFLGTLDIWSGSVVSLIYGFLIGSHPSYAPIQRFLISNAPFLFGNIDKDSWSAPLLQGSAVQLMTPLEARSVSVIVLTLIYAYRVYAVHYRAPSSAKMDARRIWKNVKSQQGTPVKADASKEKTA